MPVRNSQVLPCLLQFICLFKGFLILPNWLKPNADDNTFFAGGLRTCTALLLSAAPPGRRWGQAAKAPAKPSIAEP
jgi:hypothetical protein